MIFYITIKNKKFKVRNSIIIGRGTPFTHLEDCQDIARSHAKLTLENRSLYIEDLGSDFGTYVNNLQIEPNKKIKISMNDNIAIGKQELTISKIEDDRKVKRVLNYVSAGDFSFLLTFISLIFIALFQNQALGFQKYHPELANYLSICFFLIIFLQVFRGIAKLGNFYPILTDVVLGGDGITLHYSSGENFSVKFSKIKSLYKTPRNLIFKAHGKLFKLNRKEFKLICETIEKRNERFKKKLHPQLKNLIFPIISFFALIFIGKSQFFSYYLTFMLWLLVNFLWTAIAYLVQFKTKWAFYSFRGNRADKIYAGTFVVLFGLGLFFVDPYRLDHMDVIKVVEKCLATNDKKICEQVNYDDLYEKAGKKKSFLVLVNFACKLKVDRACYYVNIHERIYE